MSASATPVYAATLADWAHEATDQLETYTAALEDLDTERTANEAPDLEAWLTERVATWREQLEDLARIDRDTDPTA